MKKILLMVAMLFATNFAFAQLSKGNLLVTGGFSIRSTTEENKSNGTTTDGPSTTTFSFIPNVSYFITDRFSVGLELGINNSTTEEVDVVSSTTTVTTKIVTSSFGLAPFVRYYVPLGQNFYFYGQGSFGIVAGGIDNTRTSVSRFGNNTTTTENKIESDLAGFNFGLRPGVTYFLNNRFALDASIGLLGIETQTVTTGDDETSQSQFEFSLIPNSINFGLSYRFGGTGN